ncbi:MAG: MaoC family dehydratase [Pseudomonadota bacterium]
MRIRADEAIPPWTLPRVTPERMRTMAALLRDPNPVHWDRDAVAALPLGLGRRTINQGPLGLSYIINMLHEWAGAGSIRRLTMRFPQVVLDGDKVTARGTVLAIDGESDARLTTCQVWLEHADRGILLEGEAIIATPEDSVHGPGLAREHAT